MSEIDPHTSIDVYGAREHNLKNIHLSIPRNQLVVFTGLSGSGKSSLAFDTIFAEGQRRFLDVMSPYARQFVEHVLSDQGSRVLRAAGFELGWIYYLARVSAFAANANVLIAYLGRWWPAVGEGAIRAAVLLAVTADEIYLEVHRDVYGRAQSELSR